MDFSSAVLCGLVLVAAGAALYGLHRLCLWLEECGLLYYKHKKPGDNRAGCLLPLHKALEPQTEQVYRVKEAKRNQRAPGQAGPSPSEGNGPEPPTA